MNLIWIKNRFSTVTHTLVTGFRPDACGNEMVWQPVISVSLSVGVGGALVAPFFFAAGGWWHSDYREYFRASASVAPRRQWRRDKMANPDFSGQEGECAMLSNDM